MDSKLDMIQLEVKNEIVKVESISGALEKIDNLIQQIGLIVLDIIMPHEETYTDAQTNGGTTTGLELLKDIRKKHPDVLIMIISIRRKSKIADIIERYKVSAFLAKPISGTDIGKAIRQIIS